MKDMNIPFEKILDYKNGGVWNRDFMASKRLNMAELATILYLMNHMS